MDALGVDHGKMDGTAPTLSLGFGFVEIVSLKSSGLKWALQTLEYSVGFHKVRVLDAEDEGTASLLIATLHLKLTSGSDGNSKPPRPVHSGTLHLFGMMAMGR